MEEIKPNPKKYYHARHTIEFQGINNESLKNKIQVIDIASFLGKLLFLL